VTIIVLIKVMKYKLRLVVTRWTDVKTRKWLVLCLAAWMAVCTVGCGGTDGMGNITIDLQSDILETVKGSGNFISKEVEIPEGVYELTMEGISYSNSTFRIVLDPAESSSRIEGDDNVVEALSVEADEAGQTLTVVGDSSVMYEDVTCVITVNAPVQAVTVDGTAEVEYTVADEVTEVKVEETGASQMTVRGSCESAVFELSGSSTVDATGLMAERVDANVSGASSANVCAEQELTAVAAGASCVRYSGDPPTVEQDASEASWIEKLR
jgi:hypothetical protein